MILVGLRDEYRQQLPGEFQTFDTLADLPETFLSTESLAIDSCSISFSDVIQYRDVHEEIHIYFVVEDVTTALRTSAAANHIEVTTMAHLVSTLESTQNRYRRPLLAFWGVLPQLGTTSITTMVGYQLAQQKDRKVGVLGLNLYDSGSWIAGASRYSLDDIRTLINTRELTNKDLQEHMTELVPERLYYLAGNRNQLRALRYRPEDIVYLIEVAQKVFDIVLLDAGSILNTAASLVALQSATYRFGIVTDRQYIQERYKEQLRFLQRAGLRKDDIGLIGNRLTYPRNFNDLTASLGSPPITAIGQDLTSAVGAENSEEPIKYFMSRKEFQIPIAKIVDSFFATV